MSSACGAGGLSIVWLNWSISSTSTGLDYSKRHLERGLEGGHFYGWVCCLSDPVLPCSSGFHAAVSRSRVTISQDGTWTQQGDAHLVISGYQGKCASHWCRYLCECWDCLRELCAHRNQSYHWRQMGANGRPQHDAWGRQWYDSHPCEGVGSR